MDRLQAGVGLVLLLATAWLLGDRSRPDWRAVRGGLGLLGVAALVLLHPATQSFATGLVDVVVRRLLTASDAGAAFVFGAHQPHQIADADGLLQLFVGRISPPLRNFAFGVLPTVIFFSSLAAILDHVGLSPFVVRHTSRLVRRVLGTSGAETVSSVANIFLGQTEAPLLVRQWLPRMTRSELFSVMVGGFSNSAGAALAVYASLLADLPAIGGHLVVSQILSAPAGLAVAKLMCPERDRPETSADVPIELGPRAANVFHAAASGATQGMKLCLNITAMLIAFVGLQAALDGVLAWLPLQICGTAFTLAGDGSCRPADLSSLVGLLFRPVAWAIGVAPAEVPAVAQLLGEKTVLTEIVAYVHLGEWVRAGTTLSPRGALLSSYALCGFASFVSIGIQIGALGAIAPKRQAEVAGLSLRAMLGGTIATCLTACMVAIFG